MDIEALKPAYKNDFHKVHKSLQKYQTKNNKGCGERAIIKLSNKH